MDAQRCVRRAQRPTTLMVTTAVAVLVALGVAGCTDPTPPASTTSAQAGPSASPSAQPTTSAPAAPTPSPTPTMILPPGASATSQQDGPLVAAPLPTTSADLTEEVAFDTGMNIEIVSIEAVRVTAETPGEMSGPALRVTVAAHNGSTEPQAVDSAVVSLLADGDELGVGTTAGRPSPLRGTIAPGASATGTYVFMLDPAAGRDITVAVNYAAGEPVAVFTGKSS